MTHTPDNCPAYLTLDEQKKFFADIEKMQKFAEERKIKIYFMVGGVGHTMYALLETDDFIAMNTFFTGFPFKQDYQIEPVGHAQDMIAAFKAESEKS